MLSFVVPDNPYVAPISPSRITVIEQEPLTLRFRVAVNSDGNRWDTSRTIFTFIESPATIDKARQVARILPFRNSDPNAPQDYIHSFLFVGRSDGGVYTAHVTEQAGI